MRLNHPISVLLVASLGMVACSSAGGADDRGFSQSGVRSGDDPPASDDPGSGDSAGSGGSTLCDPPKPAGGHGGSSGQGGSGTDAAAQAPPPDAAPACTYPTGPSGSSVGNVLSSAIQWTGYEPGATSASSFSPSVFLDCDGSAGINAVLFVHGNVDCMACQQEAESMPARMQSWGPAGVVVVYLLLLDANGGSPTAQTAKDWRDNFKLNSIYVAADPYFALQNDLANAIPYEVLVDPRTMKIVDIYMGGADDDKVLSFANQNKP